MKLTDKKFIAPVVGRDESKLDKSLLRRAMNPLSAAEDLWDSLVKVGQAGGPNMNVPSDLDTKTKAILYATHADGGPAGAAEVSSTLKSMGASGVVEEMEPGQFQTDLPDELQSQLNGSGKFNVQVGKYVLSSEPGIKNADLGNGPAGTAASPMDGQRDSLVKEEIPGTGKIAADDKRTKEEEDIEKFVKEKKDKEEKEKKEKKDKPKEKKKPFEYKPPEEDEEEEDVDEEPAEGAEGLHNWKTCDCEDCKKIKEQMEEVALEVPSPQLGKNDPRSPHYLIREGPDSTKVKKHSPRRKEVIPTEEVEERVKSGLPVPPEMVDAVLLPKFINNPQSFLQKLQQLQDKMITLKETLYEMEHPKPFAKEYPEGFDPEKTENPAERRRQLEEVVPKTKWTKSDKFDYKKALVGVSRDIRTMGRIYGRMMRTLNDAVGDVEGGPELIEWLKQEMRKPMPAISNPAQELGLAESNAKLKKKLEEEKKKYEKGKQPEVREERPIDPETGLVKPVTELSDEEMVNWRMRRQQPTLLTQNPGVMPPGHYDPELMRGPDVPEKGEPGYMTYVDEPAVESKEQRERGPFKLNPQFKEEHPEDTVREPSRKERTDVPLKHPYWTKRKSQMMGPPSGGPPGSGGQAPAGPGGPSGQPGAPGEVPAPEDLMREEHDDGRSLGDLMTDIKSDVEQLQERVEAGETMDAGRDLEPVSSDSGAMPAPPSKIAVDAPAKEYYKDYFGDYGVDLAKDRVAEIIDTIERIALEYKRNLTNEQVQHLAEFVGAEVDSKDTLYAEAYSVAQSNERFASVLDSLMVDYLFKHNIETRTFNANLKPSMMVVALHTSELLDKVSRIIEAAKMKAPSVKGQSDDAVKVEEWGDMADDDDVILAPPAHLHMSVEDKRMDGKYLKMTIKWDADSDAVKGRSFKGLEQMIISFVKGLESNKEFRDYGFLGQINLDEVDHDAGIAEIFVRTQKGADAPLGVAEQE